MYQFKLRLLAIIVLIAITTGCKDAPQKENLLAAITTKDYTTESKENSDIEADTSANIINTFVDSTSNTTYQAVNSIFTETQNDAQSFLITVAKKKTIKCSKGTKIHIPANAFINAKTGKPILGNVQLNVKEFYTKEDFVLGNLSTTSNNKLLESGGTIHIAAYSSQGEKCALQSGKNLKIEFPFVKRKEGMELFYGDKNENGINWTQPQTIKETENAIITAIEKEAQFPGGFLALQEYLSKNIKYPKIAYQEGIRGTVYVEFEITKTGKIENVRATRSSVPALSREAVRVVKSFPNFLPARNNGVPVKTQFTLPVEFQMDGIGTTNPMDKLVVENGRVGFGRDSSRNKSVHVDRMALAKNLNQVSTNEVSSYILTSAQLGWINCDRFYRSKEKTIYYAVNTGPTDNVNVKLIFDDMNGVMAGKTENGKCVFKNVPMQEKVTVFALKNENSQFYVATAQTTIASSTAGVKLDYIPIEKEDLRNVITQLVKN